MATPLDASILDTMAGQGFDQNQTPRSPPEITGDAAGHANSEV
jgi:hypothetical protein